METTGLPSRNVRTEAYAARRVNGPAPASDRVRKDWENGKSYQSSVASGTATALPLPEIAPASPFTADTLSRTRSPEPRRAQVACTSQTACRVGWSALGVVHQNVAGVSASTGIQVTTCRCDMWNRHGGL